MFRKILLCIMTMCCLCACNKEQTTNAVVSTEQSATEVFQSGYYVVTDGYEFIIDKKYQVYNLEDNIYFDVEGKFNGKLSVVYRSFAEYKSNLDILRNNILENSGQILLEPNIINVGEKEYVFAKFKLNKIDNYIIVAEGLQGECFVAQLSLEGDMDNAELIQITKPIFDSAKATSVDNTTADEIEAQRNMLLQGKNKNSSNIIFEECEVQFRCPTGIHSIDSSTDEYYSVENFQRLADNLYVTVMLYKPTEDEPDTAKGYIDSMVREQNDGSICTESITYNNRTFYYYYVESVNTDGTKNYDIELTTDIDDYIYYVAIHKLESTESITLDNFLEFLDIQVK